MPKKLMDCIKKVQEQGKSESEAWAICQESTGLKPHKKSEGSMLTKEQVNKLVAMADKLDERGLHQEANQIDVLIKEAGFKEWLGGVWNAIKGNPPLQDAYTKMYQNMRNVTVQLRDAVDEINGTVATLEKLVEKPNLNHMANWAKMTQALGNKIEIGVKAVKEAGKLYRQFEEFGNKVQSGEGLKEKGVPTKGLPGQEAPEGPEQAPEGMPQRLWESLSPEQKKLWEQKA